VRTLEIADLTVHLAGGDDREGGGTGPLVVLLHGFGAPGRDLVPLWRELAVPRSVRFAFPEAPMELELGAPADAADPPRAWWMIDFAKLERAMVTGETRDLTKEIPPGIESVRESVAGAVDELVRTLAVPDGKLVLGGFSQGAMLALDVALRSDRALAGVVLLSTTLLMEDEWTALMKKRAPLRIFQSHGRADPLLPFSIAERLRDELTRSGHAVELVAFNGGHEISGGVLDALSRFLSDASGER
jgi:phospholipase/carboxylesterase